MKILFVCKTGSQTSETGEGTQSRETAAALSEMGHEVVKAFVSPDPFSAVDSTGSPVSESGLKALSDSCDVVHLMPATRKLAGFWRRLGSCTPVAGSTVFWSGWERLGVTRLSVPFGFSRIRREITYLRMMASALQDFRGIRLFLPNTHDEGTCVAACFRHDPEAGFFPVPNAFRIPPFAVQDLPRPTFVPKDGEYMVVPGIFALRKNQLTLIRALKATRPDIPVVFIGGCFDAPLDRKYFARCKAEAAPAMSFAGFVPSSSREYWGALRHARCACLPSDCETPGIALLEAAYAGARPVATRFGGTKEYFGFDGEYFHPCRPDEIADAIGRAWRRGRLGACSAAAYSRFSWKYCAELTVQAYETLLAGGTRRPA